MPRMIRCSLTALLFAAAGAAQTAASDLLSRPILDPIQASFGGGLKDVFLTKMACEDPAGSLETAVLDVINAGSVRASIRANVLTLQAGGRGLQLTGS